MFLKNCVNCGAPINEDKGKCEYCGSSYFDMSFINLQDSQPFYLILKINGMKIVQLVKPTANIELVFNSNNMQVIGRNGNKVSTLQTGYDLKTKLQFNAVAASDKVMMKIFKEN